MIRHLVSTYGGTALTVAAALAFVVPAEAQMRGGRVFGGTPSGGYYPGGYYPGQYGYGGMQYGYPGQYGYGGYGGFYQPGTVYNYPGSYTFGQQYGMPQYGYTQQYPMVQNSGVVQAGYQPMGTTGQPMGQQMGNTARLTVKVPQNAQLWVENQQMPQQGGQERVMNSPPLQPGQTYHYTIKAQWDDNGHQTTQERMVNVQAGANVTVDFTQPEGQQPQPPQGTTPQTRPEPVGTPTTPTTPPNPPTGTRPTPPPAAPPS
ncbi:MAG TPA: TIGR03000 domain-containing protein [Gemmataceae bacterium]|jgi:uncharacterized protein (TIGR03000 family)